MTATVLPLLRSRLLRVVVVVASVTVVAASVGLLVLGWIADRDAVPIGLDLIGYRRGFERFLATGSPYEPFQLAGPFIPKHLDFIHPPSFLPLVGPFTLVPTPFDWIAWVAAPLALWLALLRRMAWWAYPVAAVLAVHDSTVITVLNGNSSLWFSAAFGWSLFLGWPAGLIAIKPSLAPLAIPGLVKAPRRFIALAVLPVVVTLPFVGAWTDFVTVLRNSQGLGPLYSLVQWPVFLLLALPWLTTRGVDLVRRRGWLARDQGATTTGSTSRSDSPLQR